MAAIESARAANAVSAPVNPYAPVIEGVLGLAAIVAGGYGLKQHKDKTLVAKKYTAHKRGVEALMRDSKAEDAKIIYDAIGEERKKVGL